MPDSQSARVWVRIPFAAVSNIVHCRSLHDAPVQSAVQIVPAYRLGPCAGLTFRPRPGPQIWSGGRARSVSADPARVRPARLIMRHGPGPARKKYVQARPVTQLSYLSPRPGPSPRDPDRAIGPDHIPQKQFNTCKKSACIHTMGGGVVRALMASDSIKGPS